MYVPSDLVVFQLAKVARIKIFITLNASDLYVAAAHSISAMSWRKFQKYQLLILDRGKMYISKFIKIKLMNRGRRCGFSRRCDQQLTFLVNLLKICDIMEAAILFFVLKYEVLIVLPDTHELLLCLI